MSVLSTTVVLSIITIVRSITSIGDSLTAAGNSYCCKFSERPELADCNDFYELVVNDAFVDKSMMIEEFLKSGKVVRIVRPKGWGKTVNMDMLKRFFEAEMDLETGAPISDGNRTNLKLFAGGTLKLNNINGRNKLSLRQLKIASARPDLLNEKFGRYGVVRMNWRVLNGENKREIEIGLRNMVRNLYNERPYLGDRVRDENERKQFDSYTDGSI